MSSPHSPTLTPEQRQRLVHQSVLLRQGERMIMLEDARANLALCREAARAGLDLPPEVRTPGEDPMILGDIITTTHLGSSQRAWPVWLGWLLGPALGAGLAVGVPLALEWLSQRSAANPPVSVTPREDLRYQIGIHRPESSP